MVVPISGDNDLQSTHYELLVRQARDPIFATKRIFIVLHGDRHVWDVAAEQDPIRVKLRSIFHYSSDIHFHPVKLDSDTAESIARQLVPPIKEVRQRAATALASIALLLGQAPVWDEDRRLLDLYDAKTGFNLLHGRTRAIVARVLGHVSQVDPTTLRLTNAALTRQLVSSLALTTRRIDLSGNDLDWRAAAAAFPRAEWINLAANGLSAVDLEGCSGTLREVYLHKNAISQLHFPADAGARIRVLSLYRNCLQRLNLPPGLRALTKLNLGANPISELPEALSEAHELRFLGIARTTITTLPPWLRELRSLRQVDISHMEHLLPHTELAVLTERGIEIIRKPGHPS